MGKPKVLIARQDFPSILVEKLEPLCDLVVYEKPGTMSQAEFLRRVPGMDGVVVSPNFRIDAEMLDAAGPSLKVISTCSVGYDHIDVEEVKKRKVKVGVTADVVTKSCSELTVALLLATARRLFACNAEITNGGWARSDDHKQWMLGRSLAGSTVGIFGLGRIGQEVLRKLSVFDVEKFLYNSQSQKTLDTALPPAEFVSFERLLRESDFVVCTAALNDQTRAKFDRSAFTAMKETAVFVNVSRGGLVDQDALVWALQTGQIWAAGLDVMTPEPLPTDHVLTTLPNCTLLPHIGTGEVQTRHEMAELTADNIIGALFEGGRMPKQLC